MKPSKFAQWRQILITNKNVTETTSFESKLKISQRKIMSHLFKNNFSQQLMTDYLEASAKTAVDS